jgi:hypothetical protein
MQCQIFIQTSTLPTQADNQIVERVQRASEVLKLSSKAVLFSKYCYFCLLRVKMKQWISVFLPCIAMMSEVQLLENKMVKIILHLLLRQQPVWKTATLTSATIFF